MARLIKKCNDFGAGGASVAIGELAEGVEITLDSIPVKYEGMDGTELAISESQERMAVVITECALPELKRLAEAENTEATVVARITEQKQLVMIWRGQKIVDISRSFLDTNGSKRYVNVSVPEHAGKSLFQGPLMSSLPQLEPHAANPQPISTLLLDICRDINFCSQKGLVERFDHSIGASSILAPYGGRFGLSETQVMAALLPVQASGISKAAESINRSREFDSCADSDDLRSESLLSTTTASVMSYGYNPYFTQADPFAGSEYAVVSSVAKLIASGVSPETIHLSLQEYFPSPGDDAVRWGQPFAALLGAFAAQMGLKIAAIGGKDSMSGSYEEISPSSDAFSNGEDEPLSLLHPASHSGPSSASITNNAPLSRDIPPTLISFAVGVADAGSLISSEFKGAGNPVYLLETPANSSGSPDYALLRELWAKYIDLCRSGKILSAWSCEAGGVYGGIMKMAFGNMIGFYATESIEPQSITYGSIIFEADEKIDGFSHIGYTQSNPSLSFYNSDSAISLPDLCSAWQSPLEGVFPTRTAQNGNAPAINYDTRPIPRINVSRSKPKAVIPVFPGTNCEYDTIMAIERAGGAAETVLIRNLKPHMLKDSVDILSNAISSAHLIVFPGGFSGGDEPDGSGKFIVSLFRNNQLSDAVHALLFERNGLVLGICNGFQALIKLGLLPYGRITEMNGDCPTLTYNRIGRHQARYISTRVSSVNSPWLSGCMTGEIYTQPVSHGEGRLTASEAVLEKLAANGQIVFQYANREGLPSMDTEFNPSGSDWAIEGICSEDGRILGKMAHSERYGRHIAINVPGAKFLPLFESGINYFTN